MARERALPNRTDIEYFLWIIHSGEGGLRMEEIAASCDCYSKWRPTNYQLQTGLKRLLQVGLVTQQDDRFYAAESEALKHFTSETKDQRLDWLDEYEILKDAVDVYLSR